MSHAEPSQFDSFLAFVLDEDDSRSQAIGVAEPAAGAVQARRGNFYALVELMGDSPTRSQALANIQSILQESYYSAGGPVSGILEQAIQNAHVALAAWNRRNPETELRAGILCAAVVQGHLVMASAGPGLSLLASAGQLVQFPPDPSHFVKPIGGQNPPTISIYRHQMQEDDVLFLGESDWILVTDVKTLGGAVVNTTRLNRMEVVDYLRQMGSQTPPGLFVVFQARRTAPAPLSATLPSGLPTSVSATPPVHSLPGEEEYIRPAAQRPSTIWDRPPVRPRVAAPTERAPSRSPTTERAVTGSQPPAERISAHAIGQQLAAAAANTSLWLKEMAAKILPEAGSPQDDAAGWVGSPVEPGITTPQPVLPPAAPFVPPAPTRGSRARLFVLLAVLIPLLAFATVGILNLRRGAATQAAGQNLVDQAEAQLAKAEQALNLDDKAAARSALNDAQRSVNEATNLIGPSERSEGISQRIGTEMQKLMNVRLLYSLDVPLVEFPADAALQRVIVFDQDVYVLDSGRQLVEHFRTDPSRAVVEERSGAVLQEGDVVDGVTVGRLVDIAWQPRIPGFADKASLLILDRNNNIFSYNQIDAATVVRLADTAQLQSIGQIETYNGRLYLADEQRNQIWRYSPAGLGYDEPPSEWFDPQVQANLAGVVAFAIDSDIWLLMENGTLLRYSGGGQLPFSLDTSAGVTGQLADMAVSSSPEGKIYMADSSQERILVFDKLGNYIEQLQAAENDALRGLRGLYLDEVSGTLFILTQTSLYGIPLPE